MENELFNILTEEEKNMPVTWASLAVLMSEFLKGINEADKTIMDHSSEAFDILSDHVGEYIMELRYQRIRDVKFFIQVISQLCHVSNSKLTETYYKWCTEYDEMNRSKEADD